MRTPSFRSSPWMRTHPLFRFLTAATNDEIDPIVVQRRPTGPTSPPPTRRHLCVAACQGTVVDIAV